MYRILLSLSALAMFAQSPSDLNRVQPGAAAPAFELTDADGKVRSLKEFRGKDVVLVFYRGHW